jgi:hypothetical protein
MRSRAFAVHCSGCNFPIFLSTENQAERITIGCDKLLAYAIDKYSFFNVLSDLKNLGIGAQLI